MGKRFCTGLGLVLLLAASLWGQDLSLETGDLRIEQRVDGGFHLFIRKKPGIASVLLTETTRDPSLRENNYAYRAGAWNEINGGEIRLLDGAPIPKESGIWSLIDSTPENHPELGPAFHIYIPYLLYYGYPDTRNGEIYVVDGTFLNIRAFSLSYGDYRGSFRDNPFVLSVSQKPLEGPPERNYMKDTLDAFGDIAALGQGDLIRALGPEDLVDKIRTTLEPEQGKNVDLVICLDTTNSMKDDIDAVRLRLIPMLGETIARFRSFRIGMVLYKDYFESYLNQIVPFTRDFESFQKTLNGIRVGGGRDIPEAVYEALYEAALKFPWEAESKLIILIGDAPPHPRQRGRISQDMVNRAVAERGLRVNAIILPQ
jgi:Mg-chelatase subunit ChlD